MAMSRQKAIMSTIRPTISITAVRSVSDISSSESSTHD
jgi:hypothetical protein